ncbi:MAG TPA: phosphate ABC transporter substrate-binding protein [Planctomycetes bacterium]|nr:phosphate ABC transporter substrate-binding protein [Planctomycetota bacterium]
MKKIQATLLGSALAFLGAPVLAQAVEVDPELPAYTPVSGVSGNINSVGSDTMNNLMAFWAAGFRKHYPNVRVEVEGKGSSTAPPALISGTSNFAPMSRQMKSSEVDAFEKAFGYKPTSLPTSIDMLAVYVPKDNPIEGLSLPEVDAIFSTARKGGYPEEIRTWDQLGLTGEYTGQPISLYGRNSASGTYGYFKKHALFRGDYKATVKEQPGSSSVVQGVANDPFGIGYSGIGYKTADVRAVPLAAKAGGPMVAATAENAYTGKYPLARFLYLYINKEPNRPLDPLRREFIRYIFSREGQQDVLKAGYYPVTAQIAERTLKALGLDVKPMDAGAARD